MKFKIRFLFSWIYVSAVFRCAAALCNVLSQGSCCFLTLRQHLLVSAQVPWCRALSGEECCLKDKRALQQLHRLHTCKYRTITLVDFSNKCETTWACFNSKSPFTIYFCSWLWYKSVLDSRIKFGVFDHFGRQMLTLVVVNLVLNAVIQLKSVFPPKKPHKQNKTKQNSHGVYTIWTKALHHILITD